MFPRRHSLATTFSFVQSLATSTKGCLLVADITGYTAYLQATELAHAEDVLADLLETLVATLAPTFTLSKLEGDI